MENKRRDTLVPHFPSLSFFFFTSFPFLFLIFYFSFFFLSFFLESIVSIIHRTLLDANGRMVDLGMVRDPSRICIILSVRKHFCREHTVESYHLALLLISKKIFWRVYRFVYQFIKEIFDKFRKFKKYLFFVSFFK